MIRNNCVKVSGSYQCRADSGGQDPRGKCRDEPTIGATFLLETFANSLQKPRGQKAKPKQVVGSLSRPAEPPAASGGWGRAEGLPDRRSLVNTHACSRDHQRATSGGGKPMLTSLTWCSPTFTACQKPPLRRTARVPDYLYNFPYSLSTS